MTEKKSKRDSTEFIARRFFGETEGIMGEDGFWTVTSGLGESRSKDGEDWETLFIDAMSIDDDFDRGYATALSSVLNEFMAKTKERGFNSLFEAEAYDNALRARLEEKEIADEANSKSTEAT